MRETDRHSFDAAIEARRGVGHSEGNVREKALNASRNPDRQRTLSTVAAHGNLLRRSRTLGHYDLSPSSMVSAPPEMGVELLALSRQ